MNNPQTSLASVSSSSHRFISVWMLWPVTIILNSIIAPLIGESIGMSSEVVYVALGALAGLILGTANGKGALRQRLSKSWIHGVWPIVALGIVVMIFGLPVRR